MLCTARRPKPSWPHRNGDTGLWTSASSPVGSPDYHAYTILQRATLWEAETHHFSPVIPDQLVHKSPVTGQRYPSESAGSKGVTQPSPTCMADCKSLYVVLALLAPEIQINWPRTHRDPTASAF
uniref:Uncharacterized protein n=1 Tax=Mus spicilegus TaxID=10103 RepID=A0A8C6HSM7_MUSSI